MGKGRMEFEVQENESIGDCMDRMKKLGFSPIRRIEKPIFQEVINGSQTTYEPVGRKIIFEAKEID
ncbi:NETI motif-containing protein [Bacillus sp. EB600]|uniref:NETI motif-containing protein n=1 Tax=Bacillus sp. EB600 TaxID=2806345 RepID=UPI00210BE701|nr:NETI motif-containing protein [Bacillus sp. EB600]MCQ6280541.1 NETI motif-containing protein [Bacillus sp. EB600]